MLKYSDLLKFLRLSWYRESTEVLASGDFSNLGDIVIVWPVNFLYPVRLHYFGEEIEKIEKKENEKWQLLTVFTVDIWPNELKTEHGTIHSGEYVVHPYHGVGIFSGIITRQMEGESRQFINLLYAAEDRLFFPYDRHGELMPYIGSAKPRLTRLYSKSWQNLKEKIQRDLIGIARTLLTVYAARQLSNRPVYPASNEWLDIINEEAGFDLTVDQKTAMQEIEYDLGTVPHPMDRLVCGDVGFGKTEVALRAAIKVLAQGKQVALVAPTTVLAEQHYTVFKERLKSLPIQVEHISRLTGDRTGVLTKLAEGTVDMIVGTHRLLSKDVQFSNLGLLIVDEEQKFGVNQKEFLKESRPSIDVLSLSATPIPRTLSMSLSGLRGLSILRTPPQGRLPIKTKVASYSDAAVAHAIAEELKRGGQVYVVHNRVQSLISVRQRLESILEKKGQKVSLYEPGQLYNKEEVTIGLAHGQMDELSLARTMSSFLSGEITILLASSIVEHGLDSPFANTLIVLHSERFGLSDLYQLRGRVGRRQQQAYAYFLLGGIEQVAEGEAPLEASISELAKKRLAALEEASELGSGWSIALRDLEIRGGGNVLGHEQHGNMEAIGLLLYAQLLQEEIGRQAHQLGISLVQKRPKSE